MTTSMSGTENGVAEAYRVMLVEADPRIGGSGRSLETIIAGVDRHRFHLSAVCRPDGPIAQAVRELGVEPHWPASRFLNGRRLGARAAWVGWLARLIRRRRIDLVHVNDVAGFRLAGLAARLAGAPAVCHIRMARSREGLAWSFAWAAPDAVIYNSRGMSDYTRPLLSASVEKAHGVVAPNAVPTDRFRPSVSVPSAKARMGWPTDEATVTVVSNLSPLKGQDVFVEAAAKVATTLAAPVAFHLVGRDLTPDGRLTGTLQRRCRALGLGGQVHFDGVLDDVVPAYQASDVVVWSGKAVSVCPSGDGTPVKQVGFPRCVIEAAACGRPLVLSDTPGAAEAVQPDRTALVVRPEDPEAMARAILVLLNDRDRREAMGRAARSLAEARFGIAQHGRLIGRVYENAIFASRARAGWAGRPPEVAPSAAMSGRAGPA